MATSHPIVYSEEPESVLPDLANLAVHSEDNDSDAPSTPDSDHPESTPDGRTPVIIHPQSQPGLVLTDGSLPADESLIQDVAHITELANPHDVLPTFNQFTSRGIFFSRTASPPSSPLSSPPLSRPPLSSSSSSSSGSRSGSPQRNILPKLVTSWNNMISRAVPSTSQRTPRKKALLIGIQYKNCTWPADLVAPTPADPTPSMSLDSPHHDAKRVKEMLELRGYDDIRVLLDDPALEAKFQPTKKRIIKGMNWLVRGAQSGDKLFFYFAGHGWQIPDLNGDEDDGWDEVILPIDFVQLHEAEKGSGVIVDDDIHDMLVTSLPAGCQLTAISDCCHSGTNLDLRHGYTYDHETKKVVPTNRIRSPISPISETFANTMNNARVFAASPVTGSNPTNPNYRSSIEANADSRSGGAASASAGAQGAIKTKFSVERSGSLSLDGTLTRRPTVTSATSRFLPPRRQSTAMPKPILGHVISWSACQDAELAQETVSGGGIMTSVFKKYMDKPAAQYTYKDLLEKISLDLQRKIERARKAQRAQGWPEEALTPHQVPQLYCSHQLDIDTHFIM
ncbi:hypothetical protein BOTBODRAFT_30292 [Botryobasidium botryosum FD-172 SS1]|uniref:Peptidase C14 caspase domain-containing protein n=1 Tax=Botryobasidium botryosum (strain FD-172 SS1) TaxID=930990 RepID=A0A067MQE4_BOTB1|nr:hypothetical protein BOTBODRAFT_30292 [Botryobasidium botryosum FD-172 SS1]